MGGGPPGAGAGGWRQGHSVAQPGCIQGLGFPGLSLICWGEAGGAVGLLAGDPNVGPDSSQLPNQFKFAPEMNEYLSAFLESCRDDPERQLAVVVAFTCVTNQGLPVLPTFWRVVRSLSAPALKGYVAWLRDMFLRPDLDSLVDFSTSGQKKAQDASLHV